MKKGREVQFPALFVGCVSVNVGKVVPRTDSGILYAQYMEALRAEERKMGRQLLPSELDRFAREYHAPEYGAEVRMLLALGIEESDEDE